MDELRRILRIFLIALAAPFVVILMILLALLAGLTYYLAALIQAIWLPFRTLVEWIRPPRIRPPLQEPHFVKTPIAGKPVE